MKHLVSRKCNPPNCQCEKHDGAYIAHFSHYVSDGTPVCYLTATEKTLKRWAAEQTPEQIKLTEWIKKHDRRMLR